MFSFQVSALRVEPTSRDVRTHRSQTESLCVSRICGVAHQKGVVLWCAQCDARYRFDKCPQIKTDGNNDDSNGGVMKRNRERVRERASESTTDDFYKAAACAGLSTRNTRQ